MYKLIKDKEISNYIIEKNNEYNLQLAQIFLKEVGQLKTNRVNRILTTISFLGSNFNLI